MTIGCVFEISGFFTPRTQPPPLLVSKAQIEHLMERNSYTQKLLSITDELGKSAIAIHAAVVDLPSLDAQVADDLVLDFGRQVAEELRVQVEVFIKPRRDVLRDDYALPRIEGPLESRAKPSDPRIATRT
jgi:hypothetical protein